MSERFVQVTVKNAENPKPKIEVPENYLTLFPGEFELTQAQHEADKATTPEGAETTPEKTSGATTTQKKETK